MEAEDTYCIWILTDENINSKRKAKAGMKIEPDMYFVSVHKSEN